MGYRLPTNRCPRAGQCEAIGLGRDQRCSLIKTDPVLVRIEPAVGHPHRPLARGAVVAHARDIVPVSPVAVARRHRSFNTDGVIARRDNPIHHDPVAGVDRADDVVPQRLLIGCRRRVVVHLDRCEVRSRQTLVEDPLDELHTICAVLGGTDLGDEGPLACVDSQRLEDDLGRRWSAVPILFLAEEGIGMVVGEDFVRSPSLRGHQLGDRGADTPGIATAEPDQRVQIPVELIDIAGVLAAHHAVGAELQDPRDAAGHQIPAGRLVPDTLVLLLERTRRAGTDVVAVPDVIAGAQGVLVQPVRCIDDDVAPGALNLHAALKHSNCARDLLWSGRTRHSIFLSVDLPDPRHFLPPWSLGLDVVHPEVDLRLDVVRPQVVITTEHRNPGRASPFQRLFEVGVLEVAALGGLVGEEGDAIALGTDQVHGTALRIPVIVGCVPSPHGGGIGDADCVRRFPGSGNDARRHRNGAGVPASWQLRPLQQRRRCRPMDVMLMADRRGSAVDTSIGVRLLVLDVRALLAALIGMDQFDGEVGVVVVQPLCEVPHLLSAAGTFEDDVERGRRRTLIAEPAIVMRQRPVVAVVAADDAEALGVGIAFEELCHLLAHRPEVHPAFRRRLRSRCRALRSHRRPLTA